MSYRIIKKSSEGISFEGLYQRNEICIKVRVNELDKHILRKGELYRMSNCDIRRVKKGDSAILAYIQVASWKQAYSHIIPQEYLEKFLDIDYVTSIYERLLSNNTGNGYIMYIEGHSHCIAYWDKARNFDLNDMAEIICIHSLPNNWRKGYGTIMMDKMLYDIKLQGYTKVILWVFKDNEPARSFYEACGFKETGECKESLGAIEISYIKEL